MYNLHTPELDEHGKKTALERTFHIIPFLSGHETLTHGLNDSILDLS